MGVGRVIGTIAQQPLTAAEHARLHIEVLRHFRVTSGGLRLALGGASERLVALVALEDRSLTRDQAAGALWPDSNQARAAANLRQVLSTVRRLAPGLLSSEAHRLSLGGGASVDVRAQRDLIEAVTAGERRTAGVAELRLLRGDLLPDWDEPWLEASREELRQLRMISLETLAAAHLGESRPATALAIALYVACDEPLRESANRLVVEAHLAQGNWAEAARQYTRYRTLLWSELRLRPGAGMEALMAPVLRDSIAARLPGRSLAGGPLACCRVHARITSASRAPHAS